MKSSRVPGNMACLRRVAAIAALLLFVAGCAKPKVDSPISQAQPTMQALKLIDLEGHELWPIADDTIKAIALIFILPDCPICNSYMPELKRLNEKLALKGIPMVLVHADTMVTSAQAGKHKREYQIPMAVALDPRRAWIQKAEATIAPEAAVFSPSGELAHRGRIDNQYAGLGKRRATVTSHDLRDACEAISAGQPVKEPRTEAIGCLLPHD